MNSNEYYCLPKMSDGRVFTRYAPSSYIIKEISNQNNVHNSYDIKKLLIHNATELMSLERNFYKSKSCLNGCHGFIFPDPNMNDSHRLNYINNLKK